MSAPVVEDQTASSELRVSPRALALALAPGTLLAGVAGGIAFPILPLAALHAGLSLPLIGFILAANRATRVIFNPLVGWSADRWGGRRTLLLGLSLQVIVLMLYALGIYTGAVSSFFLVGRLLHGPASACVFIAAQSLALHAGGSSQSGRSAGLVRTTIVLGVPVGLAVGGLLSNAVGDAMTFVVAALAMIGALGFAFLRVPNLLTKIEQPRRFIESLRAFGQRRLLAVGSLNFVLNFSVAGMLLSTLTLLIHERGLSALGRNEQGTAGLLMGLMIVIDATLSPWIGRQGDRFGVHARLATGAMVFLIAGLVKMGLSTDTWGVAQGLILVGLGMAGLGPSLLALVGRLVPQTERGTGVGLLQLCGDFGGTLGPLVGTALLTRNTAVPYLGTAAVVLCFLPVAVWLGYLESQT